ncbi:unnamed protein product [Dicrocoelium dendriticum]|nr:unnamed protein product [Dicrocoelium dendriticum]
MKFSLYAFFHVRFFSGHRCSKASQMMPQGRVLPVSSSTKGAQSTRNLVMYSLPIITTFQKDFKIHGRLITLFSTGVTFKVKFDMTDCFVRAY